MNPPREDPPGLVTSVSRHDIVDRVLAGVFTAFGMWIVFRSPDFSTVPESGRSYLERSQDIGLLFILLGPLLLALRRLESGASRLARAGAWYRRLPVASICLLAIVLVAYRVAETKTTLIDGARYFWLDDDIMISMRYAWNLARGEGILWNAGAPPVEGYSNFAWTLILTLPHLAGLPMRLASAPALVLDGALFAALVYQSARLGRALGLRPATVALGAILLAMNRWMVHWAAAGSESILLSVLIMTAALILAKARKGRPARWQLGLVLGLMTLVRVDAFVLSLAFAPAIIALAGCRRVRWSVLVFWIALPLAHFAFRRAYYGAWLPNTYALKAVDIPMKESFGIWYVSTLFSQFGAICAMQLASLRLARHPLGAWLGLVPWFAVGYAVAIGGDELPEMRFLVPVIPLLIFGAMVSAQTIFLDERPARALGRNGGRLAGRWGWMLVLFGVVSSQTLCLPNRLIRLGADRGDLEMKNVILGLAIERNTEPDALVAHYWAGATPYFSQRPAHDMLGKSDAHIAHLPGHPGQWQPGHTKYDAAWTLSQKPDVIVTALGAGWLDPAVRGRGCLGYPALCSLYDDPTFKEWYEPGLVDLPESRYHHAIFIRRGTPRAAAPEAWR